MNMITRATDQDEKSAARQPSEKEGGIGIKGIREGLLVTMSDGDWELMQTRLLKQIEERGAFFRGARMAVDVGNRIVHAAEMGALRDRLSDREISLWAVISLSPVTEQTARVLGLATRLSTPKPERTIRHSDTQLAGDDAILIQRTLRSGYRVSSHGHVVVIGDVNPGAEIIADGNVVVWGRLRGSVHAGAQGNEGSVVCALEMNPTKLRIANVFYSPSPKKKTKGAELARIVKNEIIAELWNLK